MKKINLILGLLFLACMSIFADEKGDEIATKSHNLKSAKDTYSEAEMILIDKKGNKKSRKIVMYGKDTPKGANSFVEFVEPADVKGTKFLTIGNKNGSDEQRLYLPALKKVRLIGNSSSSKSGKFMGSDLSYYDMENRSQEDFIYTYQKDETYNGKDCFVVKTEPKDPESPYAYSMIWVSKDDYFTYKLECYDKKDGSLCKVIVMAEVKVIDGVIMPVKTVVDNKKDGTKTLLSLSNVKINTGIKDDIFTVQNLEK